MTTDPNKAELRLKRLKYRAAHRGFREADIVLGLFAETQGEGLSEEELTILETLLEEPDAEIWAWITHKSPAPAAFDTHVLAMIRAFVPEAHRRLRASL